MFFLTCCTPPEDDVHHLRFGTVTDEALSGQSAQQATPTLLTSQGHSADKKVFGPAANDNEVSEDFAMKSVSGSTCMHLDEDTGKRSPATYRIAADEANFTVSWTSDSGESREVVCPVSAIEDIYTVADGQECFSSRVIAGLRPEERGGLFLVIYAESPNDQPSALCLLEGSEGSRDKLLERLKQASLSQACNK